jgi:hypothetical protein|nr:MAG TPA: hypothetical protein [Caudoviricetes sp.]
MNKTTKTEAAEIAAILQSYINVCGITQYVEPIARDFNVIEKIKCDLRICNLPDMYAIDAERRARRFLISSADYHDLRLPDRAQVLVYCDKLSTSRYVDVLDWCKRQAAAGHIVAVREYNPPPFENVCVWKSAPDSLGRIKKLFIFGGRTNAENTRS